MPTNQPRWATRTDLSVALLNRERVALSCPWAGDAIFIGFYGAAERVAGEAYAPAVRVSLLLELSHLLQHAVPPRSLVALHGSSCPARRGRYSAPFFIRNLTEPCWHAARWERLAASLTQPVCRTLPPLVNVRNGRQELIHLPRRPHNHAFNGHSELSSSSEESTTDADEALAGRLCMGVLRTRRSVCSSQVPLLERWQLMSSRLSDDDTNKARGGRPLHSSHFKEGRSRVRASVAASAPTDEDAASSTFNSTRDFGLCRVRKEVVTWQAASRMWIKATHARSTLSHLYARLPRPTHPHTAHMMSFTPHDSHAPRRCIA